MMSPPELMAHQEEGVRFLLERGSGILAFEQGLGKTLTAIAAFRELRRGGLAEHLLVICPNSLKRNWAAEIATHEPAWTTAVIGGSGKERRAALSSATEDVIIVNYEAARAEIAPMRALLQRLRAVLVLDESHYVKNRRSLTTIAARHFAPLAPFRWLLTGTPVTNSPSDIHAQLNLVANGDPLGAFEVFALDYKEAGTNAAKQKELACRLRPYLLRRTKEECLDLPERTVVDLAIPLPTWQRNLYDAMRDGIVDEVRGMSREAFTAYAPTALTRLLRLSQVASNPALLFAEEARRSGKVAEMDRVLEELISANGRKVILWSYYVGTIRALTERYARFGAVALYGETPPGERQAIVTAFQEDSRVRLFVANPAAAGTGFTLTAATYAIYETMTWRYDLYAQSQDRNHRIGQEMPVTYLRMIAEDTIDQVIAESLARKTIMARRVVGDDVDHAPVTGLTPEAFCEMLMTNHLPAPQESAR